MARTGTFWIGPLVNHKPVKLSNIQVNNHGASDHKIILGTRYSKSFIVKPKIIRKRSYKNFNPAEFIAAIQATSWWDVYSSEDVEKATEVFTNKITKILDAMAPVRSFRVRNKYAPWLSPILKAEMQRPSSKYCSAVKI
jgi:hypothetical protein